VRIADCQSDWRLYFELYQQTHERWGAHATSYYQWGLFSALSAQPPESVRLWLAARNGEVISGALCLYGNRHIAWWHAATSTAGFAYHPAHALQYEILRDACNRDFLWYDLLTSGGHKGVEHFKNGLGPVSLPLSVYRSSDLLSRVVQRVRRIWSGRPAVPP
jgi:hypothetical protein